MTCLQPIVIKNFFFLNPVLKCGCKAIFVIVTHNFLRFAHYMDNHTLVVLRLMMSEVLL